MKGFDFVKATKEKIITAKKFIEIIKWLAQQSLSHGENRLVLDSPVKANKKEVSIMLRS